MKKYFIGAMIGIGLSAIVIFSMNFVPGKYQIVHVNDSYIIMDTSSGDHWINLNEKWSKGSIEKYPAPRTKAKKIYPLTTLD